MGVELDNYGRASRVLPQRTPEGENAELRTSLYGDQHVVPVFSNAFALADEGGTFVALNPTPGTGITQGITTAFVATTPVIAIHNLEKASDPAAKRVYIDQIKALCSVVGATATNWQYVAVRDNLRIPSGGTPLTPANVNGDSARASIARIDFGNLTAPAAVDPKIVARGMLRTVLPPAFDEHVLKFGGVEAAAQVPNYAVATAALITKNLPAVILGPQQSLLIYLFGTALATTAPTWEPEIIYHER